MRSKVERWNSVSYIDIVGITDNIDKSGAIPPPSKSLTHSLLPLNPHTTLLLVSPANLPFLAILAIDNAGLLAVFQLLLISS